MLDGNDIETFHSLRELEATLRTPAKPLVFWIGAGASAWLGYPLWGELAENIHSHYSQFERRYNRNNGRDLIKSRAFPDLFEITKQLDPQRFRTILTKSFAPRATTPTYQKAIELLTAISPTRIITTNADESLERHISTSAVIQRTDAELLIDFLVREQSFICKLHGSVSAVESTVFSKNEYEKIVNDECYMSILEIVFSLSTVVFLGYSISDEYVLTLLQKTKTRKPIFGTGPHFCILGDTTSKLPESIRPIRYVTSPHGDRRAALSALDIIKVLVQKSPNERVEVSPEKKDSTKLPINSSYYLSDIVALGTWQTSQEFGIGDSDNKNVGSVIVGQGFVDAEISNWTNTSLHDLIVGLICFDHVYISLDSIARAHELLEGDLFWDIVRSDAIRVIHFQGEPALIFKDTESAVGNIASISLRSMEVDGQPISKMDGIRRYLVPRAGFEEEANSLLDLLEKNTLTYDVPEDEELLSSRVNGALLHPSIRKMLGVSDAMMHSTIPRWLAFPILRLAHLIQIGRVTERYKIGAAKIAFGGEHVASAVFASEESKAWADNVAGYVMAGRLNSDLAQLSLRRTEIFHSILKFRDTQAGVQLRSEILKALSTNSGPDLLASINAGMKENIPIDVLEKARDQMIGLYLNQQVGAPLVLGSATKSRDAIALWRDISRRKFIVFCRNRKLKPHNLCPCGSSEKINSCCGATLKVTATDLN